MKKLLGIVVLSLMWCNVGVANILLFDCKTTDQPGFERSYDGKVLKEEIIYELDEGQKQEYYVSFKDGYVYYAKVINDFSINTLEQTIKDAKKKGINLGEGGSSKVFNKSYIISFFDEEEIIATHVENPGTQKELFEEIVIDLKTNRVKTRWYGKTDVAQYIVEQRSEIWKGIGGYPIIYVCEREQQSDSDGASGASGTAFFINSKGHLLTNNHVIEGCVLSKISYKNKNYETKLIATDKTLDLALLKAEIRPNIFFNFSKDEAKKLSKVYVAGYPLGKGLSDDLKISSGIVSSLKGFEDNSNEIQIDAPINPGNSGGPIINENGDLIAIAVSGLAKDLTEGINFGIKASAAENFLKSNKINPKKSMYSGIKDNDKLLKILEEGTVYTFCE